MILSTTRRSAHLSKHKALWGVNFLIVANGKSYSALRHLAMLLPAAGVFLFNALSVKTSSLLLAISAMDPEIIGRVRECIRA